MQSTVLAPPSQPNANVRLHPLEKHLRDQWQALAYPPLRIRTVVRGQQLLVLAEHAAECKLEPKVVLEQLWQLLTALPPDIQETLALVCNCDEATAEATATATVSSAPKTPAPTTISGGLYLRVLTQRQPYQQRAFHLPLQSIAPFLTDAIAFADDAEPTLPDMRSTLYNQRQSLTTEPDAPRFHLDGPNRNAPTDPSAPRSEASASEAFASEASASEASASEAFAPNPGIVPDLSLDDDPSQDLIEPALEASAPAAKKPNLAERIKLWQQQWRSPSASATATPATGVATAGITTDDTLDDATATNLAAEPSLETPSLETPSLETPSLETPSLETSSLETPSLETSSLEASSLEASTAEEPNPESSPAAFLSESPTTPEPASPEPQPSDLPAIAGQTTAGQTTAGQTANPAEFDPTEPASTEPASTEPTSTESASTEPTSKRPAVPFEDYPREVEERTPIQFPKGALIAGLGLSALAFVGSFYIMSRPCVARRCEPMVLAQQRITEATRSLPGANTWQDIDQARRRLEQANQLLTRIPFWSSYSTQANTLRDRNTALLTALDPLKLALKTGAEAASLSQGPQPEAQWRQVLARWEAAMARLRTIPQQSPAYALAQDKLKQYEGNRLTIEEQIRQEREGKLLLIEAKRLSSDLPATVTPPQGSDPLTVLQTASERLQDAIATLERIPRGTTAFVEAAPMLQTFRSQLTTTEGERQEEQAILDSYRQGLANAEQARTAEAREAWNDATEYWKLAIDQVQRVPPENPYHTEAQTKLSEYSVARQQAEIKAQRRQVVGQAEMQVKELCSGNPVICSYRITPDLMSVQLTLDYERAVLTAGALGDAQNKADALKHVQALEAALETLSNNTKIPLEVYDPDGTLVGTHQPRS